MQSASGGNARAARSIRLTASGLAVEGSAPPQRVLSFLDSVLRGIGQVMLQNNSYTGLLFLIGVFYNSTLFGIGVLVGTAASTATAMLLGVERDRIRAGLFGFNGALVAIGLLYFVHQGVLPWIYVIVAAAFTTVVMAALAQFLDVWKVPALTAPFVITTLLFILACARFGRLHVTNVLPTAGLPQQATVEGIVTSATVGIGLFKGIAQVFFQNNFVTGIFFAVGLLVSSRKACVAAFLGSLIGVLVAWVLGAGEPAIRAGAFGFNSVLTAIALGGGGFIVLDAASAFSGLLAVVVTTVVFAAMSAALQPLGMPAMTAPFVFVVWVFLLARPLFKRLRLAQAAAE